MKKVIALLLATAIVFAATACGNQATATETEATETAAETAAQAVSETGDKTETEVAATEDAPAEKAELTVWLPDMVAIADYNNNEMTTWFEEQVNVDLDIVTIPSEDFLTKVNLALTVGSVEDLPDVILGSGGNVFNTTVLQEWADAGTIVPLTEYYNDPTKAKNINEAVERVGVDFTKQLYLPDGEIYSVAMFNQSYGNEYPAKLWIYKPWVEALGAEMPTTIDDFEDLLKKVAETDLNGNGKNDEIPFIGAFQTNNGKECWFDTLMNGYVYAGDKQYRTITDGTVSAAYTTDQWKAGLAKIQEMFAAGLIPSETLTINDAQYSAMINTEENTVFAITSTTPSVFNDTEFREGFVCVEPLSGPDGTKLATFEPTTVQHRMVVTANCKDVDAAFRFADVMCCEEAGISQRWGLKGTNWDYASEAQGAENWQPAFNDFDLYVVAYDDAAFWGSKEPTNACWRQTGPFVRQYGIANGVGVQKGSVSQYTENTNNGMSLYQKGGWAPKEVISTLTYSDEEASTISELEGNLKSYVDEYACAVMMGNKNLDSDWEEYLNELKVIGLEDYLAVVQAAYDRTK